jgi:hypothetical protein
MTHAFRYKIIVKRPEERSCLEDLDLEGRKNLIFESWAKALWVK